MDHYTQAKLHTVLTTWGSITWTYGGINPNNCFDWFY